MQERSRSPTLTKLLDAEDVDPSEDWLAEAEKSVSKERRDSVSSKSSKSSTLETLLDEEEGDTLEEWVAEKEKQKSDTDSPTSAKVTHSSLGYFFKPSSLFSEKQLKKEEQEDDSDTSNVEP